MAIDIEKIDVDQAFSVLDKYKAELNDAKVINNRIKEDKKKLHDILSKLPKVVRMLLQSSPKPRAERSNKKDNNEKVITALTASNKPLQNKDIQEATGLTYGQTSGALRALKTDGKIKEVKAHDDQKKSKKNTAYIIKK